MQTLIMMEPFPILQLLFSGYTPLNHKNHIPTHYLDPSNFKDLSEGKV